ncbi:MAG TPA: tetratricopeptide repeat protein, partial [Bacteroidia bacterium]
MRQCIFFLIVYFLFAGIKLTHARAQTADADTNQITSMIDSCRAAGEVQCADNVLKLIQKKLTSVKNEKEKSFYQRAEIRTLRNIGNVYRDNLSNLSKAMEYYQLSRKKAEEVGDKLGLAAALLNIGNIYYDLKDYQSALEYQEKSFSMFREIGDKRGIGICLNAIANIYKSELNYSKALEYYSNSLAIQEERRDTFEIMTCYYNIGQAYSSLASEDKSNNLKAMDFFQQSLKFAKAINNAEGTINALEGIGEIFLDTGNPKKAQEYYTEALKLATPSANLWVQSEVYHTLRQVYEKQGLYKEALAMFDKHIALRDTIFSQKQSRDIAIKDAQYESDKKEAAMKAQQEKEREVAAAESKKQRVIIISVILGLLFAVVFAGYIFRSLRTTRKQKALIEEQKSIVETQKKEVESQKHLVEEKQKEIIDSITYAKRLQQAILPPMHFVKKHLPYSFILYKPKDIVAGDFYWMEEKDNIVFIAAADCTGHGVPGAMVSVVCCNALNRTVKEFGLRDTGKILDKVTELVLETFEKSGEDVKDGMDISLLSFNLMTKEIYWTGANNALWYIQDKEVIEITA